MQVYTSPVPAYLLSALPPHLLSIHIPHLWAHMLLSLCRFSVNKRNKNKLKFGPLVQHHFCVSSSRDRWGHWLLLGNWLLRLFTWKPACNAAELVTSQTSRWLSRWLSSTSKSTQQHVYQKGEESRMLYENNKTCHVLIMQSSIMNTVSSAESCIWKW